jgi:acetyltransferase
MPNSIPPDLLPFFAPRGVAVVGASHNPTRLGFGLARNLLQSGYTGAVHLVNPRGGTLLGHPVYTDIAAIPDPVELAVLLVAAPVMAATLTACGERGIKAAIVASGGFREVGAEGAALEAACVAVARSYGMRLLGPNCIGLVDTHRPIDTTFLPPPGPARGHIAFLSHSGAICAALIDWSRREGFGFSTLVSLGNQADVRESDLLPAVSADSRTRVITLYLEGLAAGRDFVQTARQITPRIPIIALKAGRSSAGQQAIASHTGALAGQEVAIDAGFRRCGVIRANSTEELFDCARALSTCPLPTGNRVAVLTNAGGPGVTAIDALEAHGLAIATLQPATRTALQAFLPAAAALNNPVDMLASASPEEYAASLGHLLADPGVDAVLVLIPPPPMHTTGAVARAIIPLIQMAAKPVIVVPMGDAMVQEAIAHLRGAEVAEYRFPERAAAALAALVHYAQWRAAPPSDPVPPADLAREVLRARWQTRLEEAGEGWLSADLLQSLLTDYGIRMAWGALATSADHAAALAAQIGWPVVLKVESADVPHKSDAGGVLLNLTDGAAVRAGHAAILAAVSAHHPAARIAGITVQPMIGPGQELIVGAVRDSAFGPLLMFGSGGVEVEGLHDVRFALAPATPQEREEMVRGTWAGRKLDGFRGFPAADRSSVLDALDRVGWLLHDLPLLQEVEINPLRVLPAGQGAWALDARARVSAA